MDRIKLEEQMMNAWGSFDDVKTVVDALRKDTDFNKNELINLLDGIVALGNIKMDLLWGTFSNGVADGTIADDSMEFPFRLDPNITTYTHDKSKIEFELPVQDDTIKVGSGCYETVCGAERFVWFETSEETVTISCNDSQLQSIKDAVAALT